MARKRKTPTARCTIGRTGHLVVSNVAEAISIEVVVSNRNEDALIRFNVRRYGAIGLLALFQVSHKLYAILINLRPFFSPISDFCYDRPMACEERRSKVLKPEEVRNMWFFNNSNSRCQVFTWTCGNHMNRFKTLEKCEAYCVTGEINEMFNEAMNATENAGETEVKAKNPWWKG